ncbi:hypothetical protein C9426_16510 [Serratia sp. S1B]|nr:hypothetical protein C9426_16510 [Serratia sp. S1B]
MLFKLYKHGFFIINRVNIKLLFNVENNLNSMCKMKNLTKIAMLLFFFPAIALASISITGTRVIYNESDSSVTVKINNRDNTSSMVQAWIDNKINNNAPNTATSPFILYPAVFKIESGGEQHLRIKKIESVTNTHQESIFWLNVKDIPAAPKKGTDNYLQFSIVNKIKIFYRPAALKSQVDNMHKDLVWKFTRDGRGNVLAKVSNNSRYYASLTELNVNTNGKQIKTEVDMVAPGQSEEWVLKGVALSDVNNGKTEYGMVNDFGAVTYRPVIIN